MMSPSFDKIICVGKNYLEHAKELGDAIPEMPVLFLKPPSAAHQAKQGETLEIKLPQNHGSVHHECELVVRINEHHEITHFTLGLDMTLRDLQASLKKNGHPWEQGKVFAGSALLGPWIKIEDEPDYLQTEFKFLINGIVKQTGQGNQMRLNPKQCIAYASEYFPILAEDIFFTGTPAGVGPVQAGERAELTWNGKNLFSVIWS